MRKIIYLIAIAIIAVSCKKEPNNFVTLSGKITNKNSETITISNPQLNLNRIIKVDENGVFSDTISVKDGFYRFSDGKESAGLYLKNGATIAVTLDAKKFNESISFKGEGSEESVFLAKEGVLQNTLLSDEKLFMLPKEEFDKKVTEFMTSFNNRVSEKKLDATFVTFQKENIEGLKKYLDETYADKLYSNTKLAKGAASPKFVDYENHKGGNTSLDDLKGKYVYIDLWATWCIPCKQEIPSLEKVEKKYHDKNIAFVSISMDHPKDHEKWRKMVTDKKLSGIQLYAKDDKTFSKAYRINSIPRFILIDPNGNIIDADAPRPSNPKLVTLLESLSI